MVSAQLIFRFPSSGKQTPGRMGFVWNKKRTRRLQKEKDKRLGYRESNPGLLREQSLLRSESQRCYRYTIPDLNRVWSRFVGNGEGEVDFCLCRIFAVGSGGKGGGLGGSYESTGSGKNGLAAHVFRMLSGLPKGLSDVSNGHPHE